MNFKKKERTGKKGKCYNVGEDSREVMEKSGKREKADYPGKKSV